MKAVNINKRNKYYVADEVKDEYGFIFKHCKRVRSIIKIRKIMSNDYCFAVIKNNRWTLDKEENPRAKLLIRTQYIDNIIRYGDRPIKVNNEVNNKSDSDSEDESDNDTKKQQKNKSKDKTKNKSDSDGVKDKIRKSMKNNTKTKLDSDSDSDDEVKDKKRKIFKKDNGINTYNKEVLYTKTINGKERKYYKMPPILELKNSEKFKDEKDKLINIEVRGIRNEDLCFFKLLDISKGFSMPNIRTIILQDNSGYVVETDYIFFSNLKVFSDPIKYKNVGTRGEDLYLTYNGLVRMLYVSNSTTARKFQYWASKSLFTLQMGTLESKHQLFSETLGTSVDALKQIYSPMTTTISCIYFFTIGYVKDLRESMNISDEHGDDDIAGKYGRTIDVVQRGDQHKKSFEHVKGANLHLKFCAMVDSDYLVTGENDVKSYFKKYSFKFESMTELVIINKDKLHDISCIYNDIGQKYGGRLKEINLFMREKDHIITDKDNKNELLKKDIKYITLEKEVLNKENVVLKKKIKKLQKKNDDNNDSDSD
jgi:hypothetical protein